MLGNAEGFRDAIRKMKRHCPADAAKIAAIESRGFILGSALAYETGRGLIPIRKRGKLPGRTVRSEYALEYGTDVLEIQEGAVASGEKVVVVDDVLATGGTARASCELVEKCGGVVSAVLFLIELADLEGRCRIEGYPFFAVMRL